MAKVTPFLLKVRAFYEALKFIPLNFRVTYSKFYSELYLAYLRNPKIKW